MKRIFATLLLLNITLASCAQHDKSSLPANTKPFVLGIIDELQSGILGEKRILNIYLPEGYNINDSVRYPVTYLLDGSADEDFIHVAGIFQFNNFDWINRVPKSIVVGIATVDRRRDFTFPSTIAADKKRYPTTGHSDKFMDFLEKELQPFIQRKYKGNPFGTIIGESLGGLFATEVLFKKPSLFDKYIIISPSLWWDNGSLLNYSAVMAGAPLSHVIQVYLGVGKEGLTPTEIPRVMEVDVNLLAEKIRNIKNRSVSVHLDYLPNENHATIEHQAIFNALRILYPIPEETK